MGSVVRDMVETISGLGNGGSCGTYYGRRRVGALPYFQRYEPVPASSRWATGYVGTEHGLAITKKPGEMMLRLAAVLAFTLVAAPLQSAIGQTEEDRVLQVVVDLFAAMRQQDTTALAGLFGEGARLVTTRSTDAGPQVRLIPIDAFVAAVGRPGQAAWREFIYAPKVDVQDNLAAVWTWYTFHLGERLSHCGVDSIQLARGTDGWKIIALADSQRSEGCEAVAQKAPFNQHE